MAKKMKNVCTIFGFFYLQVGQITTISNCSFVGIAISSNCYWVYQTNLYNQLLKPANIKG